jgi:hypothetical protein
MEDTRCRVVVAVRVRPFNPRSDGSDSTSTCVPAGPQSPTPHSADVNDGIVIMEPSDSSYTIPAGNSPALGPRADVMPRHKFYFNHVFWSDKADAKTRTAMPTIAATQYQVYAALGPPIVQHAFDGYNACLFAYGQTGSGKTHSMIGPASSVPSAYPKPSPIASGEIQKPAGGRQPALTDDGNDSGLIPRLVTDIFALVQRYQNDTERFAVTCTFAEVYCERVRDLLPADNKAPQENLRVRQHPVTGPYVDGLAVHKVSNAVDVLRLLNAGMHSRATAETKMNERSSRSHAIFAMIVTKITFGAGDGAAVITRTRTSKINLVDLAGSERVSQSGAWGERLEEAKKINLSLHALSRVITMLADKSQHRAGSGVLGGSPTSLPPAAVNVHFGRAPPQPANFIVPYRDSILTWLLADSLGGNSKTTMLAAISPARNAFSQSLGTLRFANLAMQIINTVAANVEKSDAETILDLRDHIARLTLQVEQSDGTLAAKRELAQLKLELHSAQQRVRQLETDAAALRGEAGRAEADREKLEAAQKELTHMKTAKATIEQRLSHAELQHQREVSRWRAEAERNAEAVLALRKELDAAKEVSKQSELELLRRPTESEVKRALDDQTAALKAQLEEAESQLAQSRVELREVRAKCEVVERSKASMTKEIEDHQHQFQVLQLQLSASVEHMLDRAAVLGDEDGAILEPQLSSTVAPVVPLRGGRLEGSVAAPASAGPASSIVSPKNHGQVVDQLDDLGIPSAATSMSFDDDRLRKLREALINSRLELGRQRAATDRHAVDAAEALRHTHAMEIDLFEETESSVRATLSDVMHRALAVRIARWATAAVRTASVLAIERVGLKETTERFVVELDENARRLEALHAFASGYAATATQDVADAKGNEDFWRLQAKNADSRAARADEIARMHESAHTDTAIHLENVESELNTLRRDLAAVAAERNAIEENLSEAAEQLQFQLEEALAQSAKADAATQRVESQLRQAQKRIAELNATMDEWETRHVTDGEEHGAQLESVRERLNGELLDLRAALQDAEDRLLIAKSTEEKLAEAAAQADKERQEAEQHNRKLQSDVMQRDSRIDQLTAAKAKDADLARRELDRLRAEQEELRELHAIEIRELEQMFDVRQRDRDEAHDALQKLLAEARRKCGDTEQERITLQYRVDELERKLELRNAELHAITMSRDNYQVRTNALDERVTKQAERLAELEEIVSAESRRATAFATSPSFHHARESGTFSPIGVWDQTPLGSVHQRAFGAMAGTPTVQDDVLFSEEHTHGRGGSSASSAPYATGHRSRSGVSDGLLSPLARRFMERGRFIKTEAEKQRREAYEMNAEMRRESLVAASRSAMRPTTHDPPPTRRVLDVNSPEQFALQTPPLGTPVGRHPPAPSSFTDLRFPVLGADSPVPRTPPPQHADPAGAIDDTSILLTTERPALRPDQRSDATPVPPLAPRVKRIATVDRHTGRRTVSPPPAASASPLPLTASQPTAASPPPPLSAALLRPPLGRRGSGMLGSMLTPNRAQPQGRSATSPSKK